MVWLYICQPNIIKHQSINWATCHLICQSCQCLSAFIGFIKLYRIFSCKPSYREMSNCESWEIVAWQLVRFWRVCLLLLRLPTTRQSPATSSPSSQTWCGIKQFNRTERANHKEANGNTQSWVFSCQRAVSWRRRGDRAMGHSLWLPSTTRGKSKYWLHSTAHYGPVVVRVEWQSNSNGENLQFRLFLYSTARPNWW